MLVFSFIIVAAIQKLASTNGEFETKLIHKQSQRGSMMTAFRVSVFSKGLDYDCDYEIDYDYD